MRHIVGQILNLLVLLLSGHNYVLLYHQDANEFSDNLLVPLLSICKNGRVTFERP